MCHYGPQILGCDVHLFGVECYSALLSVVQIKQRHELPYVILLAKMSSVLGGILQIESTA